MKLRERACPVCGSCDAFEVFLDADFDESRLDGFAFASRKLPELMHFRMVRCKNCDLLYANPVPNSAWLRHAYVQACFDADEESRWAARTYARYLTRIARRLPDRRGALDLGAGDGAFLEQLLAAGFSDVVGVEPSEAPVAAARPEVRSLIRQGFFDADGFEPESLSLLTCFQTLEHVEEPGRLVDDAYRLLKPGGAFFAIDHNYRALSTRLLGAGSPIYDIEHLQLLSPRSLRFLLVQRRFQDVRLGSLLNVYPLAYWAKLLPMPVALKRGLRRGLARLGLDRRLGVPLWAGNLWAVGFKPLSEAS